MSTQLRSAPDLSCEGQTGRSRRGIDYQDVPRPVAALADEYEPHFIDPPHTHKRGQLLYASSGTMVVNTEKASFTVPPQRAVWIPGGHRHEMRARGNVSVRTLYIEPDYDPRLPREATLIEVSPLFRELLIEAARLPIEYDETGRDGRLIRLIMDELINSPPFPLELPLPSHPRLLQMCQTIIENPGDARTLEDWTQETFMSRRTFTRAFRKETNMSFATWRQNARLMVALSRLLEGQPVTTVALDVGYSSPSAFTVMFRRTFGHSPTQYVGTVARH
ncbi:AraC family transcriptional regulator [Henriciella aquimarina]|uniref:AraC family transcriptional regulator n=1 Tax=Henriciella aquimarina TaxID=545261 RepID=UPI0009FD6F7E|nr:helix-turn-helix transcriptional regulator [Henriciella aquimarina]